LIREASSRIETVPAEYRTDTETIEVKPASTKWVKKKADRNCLSANPDDCLVWCLVEEPAQFRTVTKRVRVGCAEGYRDNGDDCTKEVTIPAEYSERTFQRLVTPAATETVEIPAEYGERSYTVMATPASSETVTIPAEYGERTYQRLVTPAATETVEIPAEYGERTYQKLVTPAQVVTVTVPSQFGERSYQKLVTPATTEVVQIPAEYGERTYQRLVKPAGTTTVEIPAEYGERSYRRAIAPTTRTEQVAAEYGERSYQRLVKPAGTQVVEIPAEYSERSWQKLSSAASVRTIPCGGTSSILNINFETGSAVLTQSSYAEITNLENMLKGDAQVTAKLVGHTDNQGSEASNEDLSRRRAKAVYDVLVNSGIAANRLSYEGKGESSPVATNATAEGRRQNRRTEFITYGTNEGSGDCKEYTNRTYQRLVTPATTEVVQIDAEYGERTYQKLAKPSSLTSVDIQPEYNSITKRRLVKKGGFTEWREVVCGNDVTADLTRRVQAALKSRGYEPGPADNVMGAATKAALIKFQKDNGLPVGQLDFETLKALGVRY